MLSVILLYFSENFFLIIFLNIILFLTSWLGIAFSDNFIEGFFFLEIIYLSLIILATILSILTQFFLFDLVIIFIIFFSICDSILGLILTLIVFNTNKTIKFKNYQQLT